ncbi:MAG TPA: hypothetical protein VJT72_07120 [Pseudonocardiaceae bacterium]|nr:hypothetical protein [Pseudonocardiaceae bacterium]
MDRQERLCREVADRFGRAVVSSRHVTGIRVFRGQDFGDGNWPVIIDRGTWTEAQDRWAHRASSYADDSQVAQCTRRMRRSLLS